MVDFLGPEAYWWLGERANTQPSALPGLQLGAQIAQQAIQNSLQQKELQLNQQRSMIQTQEYFSKKEIQNKMMLGTADLAQRMAGFRDLTDPAIPEVIFGVMAQNPAIEPIAKSFLDMHEKAVTFKQRQDELKELRLSREQTAANLLTERIATREGRESAMSQRLGIMQQQADTGRLRAEDMSEWHSLQGDLAKEKQAATQEERSTIHEEVARRLAVMEQNTAARQQRLDSKINNLSPERRDLFKRDMDRLDVKAEHGDFAVKKPDGGLFSSKEKYGPKYFEERKKLEDSYGVSEQAKQALPLNTNLKNPISKEDYDKLPSGSEYVAPDGSTRVKK